MSKQYDKYTYDDKQYSFVEYVSDQKEDGRIIERVKLIDFEGNCLVFYLKKFFNENFTKVERTKKEKIAMLSSNIANTITGSAFTILILSIIGVSVYNDVKHSLNTEALLKEKNVCENVHNAIIKK